MAFNDKVFLIDIDQTTDIETGKSTMKISRETPVYADKQEVGLEEYSSAASSKIVLVASFELPAHYYHGEKYILSGDRKKQYEIYRAGKGRNPGYVRLPVRAVTGKNLIKGATSG